MLFEIDFESNEAIYMQLRNQVVLQIARRELRNGMSLPSVRQLADELGVNMHTVNKAYSILRNDGYLKLDRRSGAVISVTTTEREVHMSNVSDSMKLMVAEAICNDVSLEDMYELMSRMYGNFGPRQ